jgi:hypothetical protein
MAKEALNEMFNAHRSGRCGLEFIHYLPPLRPQA